MFWSATIRPLRIAIAAGLCICAPLLASRQQEPVFRATTDAVPLWVAVTTPVGDPILDLNVDDFEVFDNGHLTKIVAFGRRSAPVAVRLLVCQTPRVQKNPGAVRDFVDAMIERGLPSEPIGISGVWGNLNGVGPFSTDKAELRRNFERMFQPVRTEGLFWWSAVLNDSGTLKSSPLTTWASTLPMASGQPVWTTGEVPSVRAVVVFSPGMEEYEGMSPNHREYAEAFAERVVFDGTIVYGLAFGGRSRDKRLSRIAPESSGWLVEPTKKTDVPVETDRIWTDLRARYLLGFVPVSFDGQPHTLAVKVRRADASVRVRAKYLAPKPLAHRTR